MMSAFASLALTTLLLLAQAPAYGSGGVPIVTPGTWAKTHAAETVPLTWHWRRIPEFDVEIEIADAEAPATLDVRFSAALALADDMVTMAVYACSLSVHDEESWPAHEFDRAPELPGAFTRSNIMANLERSLAAGDDRHKYAMAHIATLHELSRPGRYLVAVYCRARVSHRPGEALVLRPEHDSYGYALDRPEERHARGYRPGADGVINLETYWYDRTPGQAQNHLTVEVR